MDEPIRTHQFVFNPSDNVDLQLVLTTDIYQYFKVQYLTLNGLNSNTTISFVEEVFTPAKLRKLASELEALETKMVNV